MRFPDETWSEEHKELQRMVRVAAQFSRAMELFLSLHGRLHRSGVSGGAPGAVDALFAALPAKAYAAMPTAKDETIAWAVWHIARIEDLTMNLLVARSAQVFDAQW
ncbi:MAG: hypothetical protein PHD32_11960 [Eubacteriales bacterium]|nr:hypothetical protein [Eubacteriales bacterium]